MEDNGTYLTINTGCHLGASPTYSPSAGDAQIGTATETISGDNWQVNFTMHHQNTRVRLHVIAYSDHMDDPWGFVAGVPNAAYGRQYNIDGTSPVVTMRVAGLNSYYLSCFKIPATSTNYNATYVRAHDFYSDYMYLTPGVDIVAGNIGFDTNSHLYGKQIPGNGYNKQIDALQNHSYTVTYRILPEALYLFQDGSCGALAEKGSRKVIGVVAKEKTNSEEGTAAAISQVKGGTVEYAMGTSNTTLDNQFQPTVARVNGWEQYAEAYQHDDGYKNTWEVSHDGVTIKANEQTRYPAYYAAAHYGDELAAQGITLTGNMVGRKWFLPSAKEWIDLFGGITTLPGSGSGNGVGNRTFDYGAAMTAAGGTYKQSWYTFATSSEIDAGSYLGFYANYNAKIFNCPSPQKTDLTTVHPFIHF